MAEEDVGTRKLVVLSLENMMDSRGNTLIAEAQDKLQKIEESIQRYLAENLGNPPEKEFELHITVKVLATDDVSRQLSWAVGLKEPKPTEKVHLQQVQSQDGVLVTISPAAFNAMLPLEPGRRE